MSTQRCYACNAVIETAHYYRDGRPVCSQACAASTEVHPAHLTKHTPGPWSVNSFSGEHEGAGLTEVYAQDLSPALISVARIAIINQAANARLIAAAPEMLALLVQAGKIIAAIPFDVVPTIHDKVRSVNVDDFADALRALLAKIERGS